MRRFSSYGPVDTEVHFYAPRAKLVDSALAAVVGENPAQGGGYLTVWAPRQSGKSWIVGQVVRRLRGDTEHHGFDVVATSVEHLRTEPDAGVAAGAVAAEIAGVLGLDLPPIRSPREFEVVFRRERLAKPLILVLDEFDALPEEVIGAIVGVFRKIHGHRRLQADRSTDGKDFLLHGVALIGVRSTLGIGSPTGTPFNVQRSVHVPNLTPDEVRDMFARYERESGQTVEPAVVRQVYRETEGQPGLTSWLGELLTETHNRHGPSITTGDFEAAYADAVDALPNANVQNLISKVQQAPYRDLVLDLFQTGRNGRSASMRPTSTFCT